MSKWRLKLENLPNAPGVYLFRGENETLLYVGKARNLRSRVRSYFNAGSSDTRAFIDGLERELVDIETLIVDNDKEAQLFENQLIKAHQPKYNFKLRDDKEFLSIRLNSNDAWPRLQVVRKVDLRKSKEKRAKFFGPYPSATSARRTLRMVNRHFQLRTCSDSEMKSRRRPCLQYQIKRCPAPCVFDVDKDLYHADVHRVELFLSSRHDELIEGLEQEMWNAAEAEAYEQAALFRDQLKAVKSLREKQDVTNLQKKEDEDVFGLFREKDVVEVAMLRIREGRLVDAFTYSFSQIRIPDRDFWSAFITQFYQRAMPADTILLPCEVDFEYLSDGLSEVLGRRVEVRMPQRGERKRLIELASSNAKHGFEQKALVREDSMQKLSRMQSKLRLPNLPLRIECIDISHLAGEHTVAAITVALEGELSNENYRSFNIRTISGGDDYGAIYEALVRRLTRAKNEEPGWEAPSLLVVDGGKGQMNIAIAAMRDVGFEVPVAGLAKERKKLGSEIVEDRIYLPGQMNPIRIRSDDSLRILAHLRDEAHRFSNRARKKRIRNTNFRGRLESVRGVGPKSAQKLLTGLGSVEAIANADFDTLRKAGATIQQARALLEFFGSSPTMNTLETQEPVRAEEDALDNAFSQMFDRENK